MLQRVRAMMRVLPAPMAAIIRFAVLTGLRPTEACESVRLLKSSSKDELFNYYNQDQQCLEHFRFPDIFLRTTKKAYLSYLSLDNYHYFANLGPQTPTWNAIRMACQHRYIKMEMRLCRKIHGSWLHSHGVSSEEVDFLQGRVNPSVFSRHYLTPDNSLRTRVLDALKQLQGQLKTG
jgi:intergrase/recombinase